MILSSGPVPRARGGMREAQRKISRVESGWGTVLWCDYGKDTPAIKSRRIEKGKHVIGFDTRQVAGLRCGRPELALCLSSQNSYPPNARRTWPTVASQK